MAKDYHFKSTGLSVKEMAFCGHVLDGMKLMDAFKAATGSKGNQNTLKREGCALMAKPTVVAYCEKLNSQTEGKRSLNRAKKRDLLAEFAENEDSDVKARIKAIEVDNLMTGDNKPQVVEVTGLSALLDRVRSGGDDE